MLGIDFLAEMSSHPYFPYIYCISMMLHHKSVLTLAESRYSDNHVSERVCIPSLDNVVLYSASTLKLSTPPELAIRFVDNLIKPGIFLRKHCSPTRSCLWKNQGVCSPITPPISSWKADKFLIFSMSHRTPRAFISFD